MINNVFLEGYWVTNLGDDLFVKIICEKYPNLNFYLESESQHSIVFENITNLTIINRKNSLIYKIKNKLLHNLFPASSFCKYKKKIPIYIEIGGSIFIMPLKKKEKSAINKRIKIRKAANKYYVIGSNFGPYYHKEQINEYKNFFRSMDGIVFRDRYSKKIFPELSNIEVAADVVFNLFEVDKYVSKNKKKNIIISIINMIKRGSNDSMKSEEYEDYILRTTINLIKEGYNVTLMSFCEEEGDLEVAKRVFNSSPDDFRESIRIFNHTNIDESLRILGESSGILATRFHAMILGWMFQKPTYVVSYSDKTTNVINDIFKEQNFITMSEVNKNTNPVGLDKYSIITRDKLERAIRSSAGQFKFLDELYS